MEPNCSEHQFLAIDEQLENTCTTLGKIRVESTLRGNLSAQPAEGKLECKEVTIIPFHSDKRLGSASKRVNLVGSGAGSIQSW